MNEDLIISNIDEEDEVGFVNAYEEVDASNNNGDFTKGLIVGGLVVGGLVGITAYLYSKKKKKEDEETKAIKLLSDAGYVICKTEPSNSEPQDV